MGEYVTDADCHNRTQAILTAVTRIEQRLYHDNGTLSIQTRLDRHERVIGTLIRLMWIGTVAVVSSATATLWALLIR